MLIEINATYKVISPFVHGRGEQGGFPSLQIKHRLGCHSPTEADMLQTGSDWNNGTKATEA